MLNKNYFSFFLFFIFVLSPVTKTFGLSDNDSLSPVGYWQTIDDVTNQARSIIKICELNNRQLFGRIIQVNYRGNEKPTDVCALCAKSDPRYNQPNLGLILLTDMQPNFRNHLIWDNGHVLDPTNGKIYSAKITLHESGNQLTLRGYLGISLFGRSQTWYRIDEKKLNMLLGKPMQKFDGYWQTTSGKYVAENYQSCQIIQDKIKKMTN